MRKYLLFIIAFTSLLPSVHARAAAQTTAKQRVNLTELNDDELLQYGQRLMEKENSDSALLCFELINKHIPADKKLYAQSLHSTGLAYYSRNSYAKAMESYMECLQVCEKNNLTDLLPHIYKDIGNIYSMFNDYQQSSSLYAKALNLARKEGDRMFVNKLLSNLICAYTPQTSIKQYWEYYNEMSRYKENRLRYHYDLLFDKGMILSYEKKNAEAINYFRKSAEFAIANKMPPISLASSYSSLADVYQAMGARDSALLYLMKNKEIARKNNQPTLMIITLRNLSEIYRNINESQSLQYKSEYLALSDSIFNLNEFNGIRNALFYYEMENKLKTISSLSETNRAKIHEIAMQRRWLITLTVFCIVVVLLVILAYIQNRRLSRSYRYLFHKSQEELAMDKIYARRIKQMQKQVEMLQKNEQQSSVMETPAPETETSAPETIDPEEPKELETDADEGTSDSSRSQIKLSAAQKKRPSRLHSASYGAYRRILRQQFRHRTPFFPRQFQFQIRFASHQRSVCQKLPVVPQRVQSKESHDENERQRELRAVHHQGHCRKRGLQIAIEFHQCVHSPNRHQAIGFPENITRKNKHGHR